MIVKSRRMGWGRAPGRGRIATSAWRVLGNCGTRSDVSQVTLAEVPSLYSKALTGYIPSQLAGCTDATILYLFSNTLTGQIPSALLRMLMKLSILALHRTALVEEKESQLVQIADR
jgi:hypothetical protein